MSDLFALAMPWYEFVLRAVVVYVVILVMVRLSGKRTVGQFTPFDMIVIVLLGTAVQNSLIGEDVSLLGGLLLAGTLVSLNWLTGVVTARSRRVEALIEGSPVLLLRDGEVYEAVMRRQNIGRRELDEAMRNVGCTSPADVALAVMETSGNITVVPRRQG